MQILKATQAHFDSIKQLVIETITTVYPHFYPPGAVDFFLSYHNDDTIRTDISTGCVYLFQSDGITVGTGTVCNNEIGRLFVLPRFQGLGYGRAIMNFLEDLLFQSYHEIRLNASLAALSLYRNRGYREIEYNKTITTNGDYLCWYVMCLTKESVDPAQHNNGISYDKRLFVTKQNTPNGEVGGGTYFHYHQDGNSVWAEYAGGSIVKGFLTGFVSPDDSLKFSYVHTNTAGEIRVGDCHSIPEVLSDGRLLMHETWQWLKGDKSTGKSQLIEILKDGAGHKDVY